MFSTTEASASCCIMLHIMLGRVQVKSQTRVEGEYCGLCVGGVDDNTVVWS